MQGVAEVETLCSYGQLLLGCDPAQGHIWAVMVANPAFINITCKTSEQMSLVNTLCWFKEYSQQH